MKTTGAVVTLPLRNADDDRDSICQHHDEIFIMLGTLAFHPVNSC